MEPLFHLHLRCLEPQVNIEALISLEQAEALRRDFLGVVALEVKSFLELECSRHSA
jgi:hypothetical protein